LRIHDGIYQPNYDWVKKANELTQPRRAHAERQ